MFKNKAYIFLIFFLFTLAFLSAANFNEVLAAICNGRITVTHRRSECREARGDTWCSRYNEEITSNCGWVHRPNGWRCGGVVRAQIGAWCDIEGLSCEERGRWENQFWTNGCWVCDWGPWEDATCGGSCSSNQRRQTRWTSPSGCVDTSWCVADSSCVAAPTPTPTPTPPPDVNPPTCTISGSTSVNINTDATYIATGSDLEGNLTEVEIWKSPTGDQSWTNIVDGCAGPVCQETTQFSSVGTYYVVCNAFDSFGNKCSANPWCSEFSPLATPEIDCTGWSDCSTTSDLLTVTVTKPGPWWQVIDADILTDGDIISSIPLSCALPGCNPLLGLEGLGGFPGVPVYGGFTASFGEGDVSSTGWLANTQSLFSRIYDYSFFSRLVRPDVELTEISSPSVNGGFFTSGGASSRGYVWYHFDGATLGDLTITGDMNIISDRKVVLLVEGADLYINGRIALQKEGEGFFMVIVGKDAGGNKGNIFVNASVVHDNDTKPELQGVFLAEAQFKTGAGNEQLHIRGMVAAYGGVELERDLTDNSTEPAEVFEFAPDLIFTYPRDLTFKKIRWKEVAP